MRTRCLFAGLTLAFAASVSACSGDAPDSGPGGSPYTGPPLPWSYQPLPAVPAPADNPTTDDKVAVGRLLFYDPVLSSDRAVACATCHSEIWGMSDGLPLSVGVLGEGPTGPGRTGPNVTSRNASTLWNVAYRKRLFWDGRAGSLEEQALMPLAEPKELGRAPEDVVADLRQIPAYVQLFAQAFPDDAEPLSVENLAKSLAALQRRFISDRAPYDQYVAGDVGALNQQSVRGMELFAEAGCHKCHTAPLFEREGFANRAVDSDDAGRFGVTQSPADKGSFRIPTLRNARDSEPYFHDGSVQSLPGAVSQEVETSVQRGESRPLSSDEVAAIVVFIDKALTDRTREPHRPKEVPSGFPVPVDGFRIPR